MKKILSLFLFLFLMVLSLAPVKAEETINDVPQSYWASTEIYSVVGDKVMNLYDGFLFKPENDVNRADFNSALLRALNHPREKAGFKSSFKDMKESHWAYDDIVKSEKLGLIYGYPDQTFRPGRVITKAEAASILSHITKDSCMDVNVLGRFKDGKNVPAWDVNQYAKTIEYGIYVNHPDEEILLPNKNLNRAETAVLLYRLRMKLGLVKEEYLPEVSEEPVVEEVPIVEEVPVIKEEPEILLSTEHLNEHPNPPTNEVLVTNKRNIIKAGNMLAPVYVYPFNTKNYNQNDVIRFTVLKDVKTKEGTLVIPANSVFHAKVENIKHTKAFNKSAEVELVFTELILPTKQAVVFPAKVVEGVLKPSKGAIFGKVAGLTLAGAAVGTGAGAGIGAIDDNCGTGIAYGVPIGAGVGLLTGLVTPGLNYKAEQDQVLFVELLQDVSIYHTTL